MRYAYITDDNLTNVQNYMYSDYAGKEFLDSYWQSRQDYVNDVFNELLNNMFEKINTHSETVQNLWAIWQQPDLTLENVKKQVDLYIKRFEVRKRLYNSYDKASGKAVENSGYRDFDNYLLLSAISEKAYVQLKSLKYLNCMLKLNDSLLSVVSVGETAGLILSMLCERERYHVNCLAFGNNITIQRSDLL